METVTANCMLSREQTSFYPVQIDQEQTGYHITSKVVTDFMAETINE